MTALPDMIGMVVRDMAAALRFYRLLGLDIPAGSDSEPHVEVITPNGYRLAWDTVDLIRSFDPEWTEPSGQRISLAFKCASPAGVDDLYAAVVGHGYKGHKAPWDAFWGQRYAVVVDPDGNKVDLFAALDAPEA
jgi:catechol 2,3-dioxygenase-like lactoylglutathione lyase family enzyme